MDEKSIHRIRSRFREGLYLILVKYPNLYIKQPHDNIICEVDLNDEFSVGILYDEGSINMFICNSGNCISYPITDQIDMFFDSTFDSKLFKQFGLDVLYNNPKCLLEYIHNPSCKSKLISMKRRIYE